LPGGERVHHGNQIVPQSFSMRVRRLHHFEPSSLATQQHFDVAKAKARGPVFVFDENSGNPLIFQQP